MDMLFLFFNAQIIIHETDNYKKSWTDFSREFSKYFCVALGMNLIFSWVWTFICFILMTFNWFLYADIDAKNILSRIFQITCNSGNNWMQASSGLEALIRKAYLEVVSLSAWPQEFAHPTVSFYFCSFEAHRITQNANLKVRWQCYICLYI